MSSFPKCFEIIVDDIAKDFQKLRRNPRFGTPLKIFAERALTHKKDLGDINHEESEQILQEIMARKTNLLWF